MTAQGRIHVVGGLIDAVDGEQLGLEPAAEDARAAVAGEAGDRAYHAEINRSKLGYPITAIIRMSTSPGDQCTRFATFVQDIPEVLDCYRVTGSDSLIMKVMASSVEHLEIDSRLTASSQPQWYYQPR